MPSLRNMLFIANDTVSQEDQRRTLKLAFKLAKHHDAQLTVMDVVPTMNAFAELLVNQVMPAKRLQEMNLQQRRRELQSLVDDEAESGVTVKIEVHPGKSFIEIIKLVIEREIDLVIKGAEPVGTDPNRAFASNDLHLFRKCPCPVWVVPHAAIDRYKRVMALVNLEQGKPDGEIEEFNATIMELALSICRLNDAKLHVVQCWDTPGVERLWQVGQISQAERDGIFGYLQQQCRQRLNGLVERYELAEIPHQVHLLKGKPEYVATALARQEEIDLVVLSSLTESRVNGLYINSSAEDILQQLHCGALAVKPADFVSPVAEKKEAEAVEKTNSIVRGLAKTS